MTATENVMYILYIFLGPDIMNLAHFDSAFVNRNHKETDFCFSDICSAEI